MKTCNFLTNFISMRVHSQLIIALLLFSFACANQQSTVQNDPSEEVWVDLFNGEDLNDWDIKIRGYELNDNHANTFRVEDGLLKVRYDEYSEPYNERFGHIFYNKPYSYYKLRVEYRFTEEQAEGGPGWAYRNNGIMFHSQPAQTMTLDQDFPDSIEYQLLGGDGTNNRTTGNICTPGTHVVVDGELQTAHCINSSSKTFHGDQWVTAELVAYGDSLIQHLINGELVMEYTQPQLDNGTLLNGGYIALQAESHPTDFRSIQILNLKGCMDPEADNYKEYYVKDSPDSCIYSD